MLKFLIELPHEDEFLACARVVRVFLESGSHYLTNAEWGCMDDIHKSWIIVEADSKEEARMVLPPTYRPEATIVRLNRFSMSELESMIREHNKGAAGSPPSQAMT